MPDALTFAIRRAGREDEAWPGYLLRNAGENYVSGLAGFGKPYHLSPDQLLNLGPEVVLPLLSGKACALPSSSRPSHSRAALNPAGRMHRCRICPQCWREDNDPYARAVWDQPLSLYCVRHKRLLLDACQACGRELDVRRRVLLSCDCGASFLNQTTSAAQPWVVGMIQKLIDPADCQREAQFAAASASERSAARFLRRLAQHSRGEVDLFDGAPRIFTSVVPTSDLPALATWFKNWPHGFISSLRCAQESLNRLAMWSDLNRKYHVDRFPGFVCIEEAMKEALFEQRRTERDTYGIRELQRITKHSHRTIERWTDAGLFPPESQVIDPVTGANRLAVSRALFLHIQRAYRAVANVPESAEVLGCSERAVRGLIACGALSAVQPPIVKRSFLVKRRTLPRLKQRLFKMVRVCTRRFAGGERLSFSECVSFNHSPSGPRWKRALDFIDRGLLRLYSDSAVLGRLDDIFVLRSDLRRCGLLRP
ncbi:TniQ family protein [Variovorax sp. J22R115]|uniref:TniQ family protein n=1 Tax=Variovorax sp. J22R115 TaxID=3053509 RepID=UPI0034DE54B6